MTNNEKIARWIGHYVTPTGYIMNDGEVGYPLPYYENSDAAAVTLLSVLVGKGYDIALEHDSNGWILSYIKDTSGVIGVIYKDGGYYPTLSQAITYAILQLIEGEANNERV